VETTIMAKYNEYTVENLAKSDDVAVIEDAVTTLKTAFKGEAARHGSLMIAAAYATVAALHAEVEKKSTLADKWEKNASTITTYYRLGLAARNLDVTPDGPVWDTATINNREKVTTVWSLLAGKGGATISAVGLYIEKGKPTAFNAEGKPTSWDGKPTQAGLLDLLSDYFTPSGEKVKSGDRKVNEAKRLIAQGAEGVKVPTSDDTDDSDNESVGGTRQIDVKFRVALGDVVRFADQITTEQWNSKEIQDLLSKASKALRDKAAFEKKNAPAEEKATA
jgi:hypothetical protein